MTPEDVEALEAAWAEEFSVESEDELLSWLEDRELLVSPMTGIGFY